jgi:hypothetical protein
MTTCKHLHQRAGSHGCLYNGGLLHAGVVLRFLTGAMGIGLSSPFQAAVLHKLKAVLY